MMKRKMIPAGVGGWAVATGLLAMLTATPALGFDSPKLEPHKNISGAHKLDYRLLSAAVESGKSAVTLKQAAGRSVSSVSEEGLLIEFSATVTDELLAELKQLGVNVLNSYPEFHRVTAEVSDGSALLALAALDAVSIIRPLAQPVTNAGSVSSGAEIAHNATIANAKYGVDGSGLTIGILSDSFAAPGSTLRTAQTSFLSSSAQLGTREPYLLEAGNYTLLLQTSAQAEVTLRWTSSVFLETATDTYEPTPAEISCRNRIPLRGLGATLTGLEAPMLEGFTSPSCGGGANTLLFSFRVPDDEIAEVSFEAFVPVDGAEVNLSLRGTCHDVTTEIVCVVPTDPLFPTITGLRNQLSGDLPSGVIVLSDLTLPATDEGAAMAELVYDIAPGAQIAFHTAFAGVVDFAQGIQRLAGNLPLANDDDGQPVFLNSSVIVDDVIYFAEPVYQTGVIAWAVEQAVEGRSRFPVLNPVAYFSAAGNAGNMAIREKYRGGGGNDMRVPPTGADLHRWSASGNGYLPIDMTPGSNFRAFLHWNQPSQTTVEAFLGAGGATTRSAGVDLDMMVVFTANSSGLAEVYSPHGVAEGRLGRNIQGNGVYFQGDAYEEVQYFNDTSATRRVYLAVDHFDGSKGRIPQMPADLELTVVFLASDGVTIAGVNPDDPSSGGPSIFGHALADGAVAVGAVNYFEAPAFDPSFGPTAEIDPEPFTAKGGSFTIFFDSIGVPSARTTFAPTLAGVDGVNTTFFVGSQPSDFDLDGFPNFFGTSAAAPNVAALALLGLQLNGALTPAQVIAAMVETAIDVKGFGAAPGTDDRTGAGLVDGLALLDHLADQHGVGTGAPANANKLWDFPNAEDWTFSAVSGFEAPASAATGTGLALTATNNTNTFGWWESPLLAGSPFRQPGTITVKGRTGAETVYRATWTVSSTAPTKAQTPGFRLRASSRHFEQTAEMTVASAGVGGLSPAAGAPATYRHFFELPAAQSNFRLNFDVMGFSPDDLAGATVALESVLLEGISVSSFTDQRLERLQDFTNSRTNNWTKRGASDLGSVGGRATSRGLELGPATSGRTSFGFWASPESSPASNLQRNRVYRATYQISSPTPVDKRLDLPSFRLRMNHGSNQMASVVHVASTRDSAPVPAADETVQIRVWFEAPEGTSTGGTGAGEQANLAFDSIFVPGSGDDPSLMIRLERLSVHSFLSPITF